MGKTNQPLVIWVATQWQDHSKVRELAEKGHTIVDMGRNLPAYLEPNLILHPKAWRWHDGQWDNLEIAIKEARKGHVKSTTDGKARLKSGNRKRSSKAAD